MHFAATMTQEASKFAPILYKGPLATSIRDMHSAGVRTAELHLKGPEEIDIPALREALTQTGVRLASIGTGMAYVDEGLSFSSDDEALRHRAVERINTITEAFSWARPAIIIGTIKGRLSDASSPQAGKERIAEALTSCANFAARYELDLVLEAINRYEQDYLHTLAEAAELIDTLGKENIRVHADTFHMNIEEVSITESLWRYRDYLGHLHFADNNRRPPGGGGLDFKAILRTLADINYRGAVGIECLPLPDGQTAAARSIGYLRQLAELVMR